MASVQFSYSKLVHRRTYSVFIMPSQGKSKVERKSAEKPKNRKESRYEETVRYPTKNSGIFGNTKDPSKSTDKKIVFTTRDDRRGPPKSH